MGHNPVKDYIRMMVDDKRYAISMKPYMFCQNCLNRDFDIIAGYEKANICPICGSKDVSIVFPS